MSSDPAFYVRTTRIEVQTGAPPIEQGERDFVWSVTARQGFHDSIFLMAYLRSAASDGFGQVQVVGYAQAFSWSQVVSSNENSEAFLDWSSAIATEVMYDTARRSLQVQAAAMDFQFDLEITSPDERPEIVPPTEEQLSKLRAAEAEQDA